MALNIIINNQVPCWDWQSKQERSFREVFSTALALAVETLTGISSGNVILTIISGEASEESILTRIDLPSGLSLVVKANQVPGVLHAEWTFLNVWAQNGICVPSLKAFIPKSEAIPFDILTMEYIEAPLLDHAMTISERIHSSISKEMGSILALMHQVQGNGFGRPLCWTPEKGCVNSFTEEMSLEFPKRLLPLIEVGIITKVVFKLVDRAIEVVEGDCAKSNSVYTHSDFGPRNILLMDNKKLIIIDPNCRYSHPLMCLALTLLRSICETPDLILLEANEIQAGYNETRTLDSEILRACKLLRGLLILSTWVRKRKNHHASRLISYLRSIGFSL